MPLKEQSVKIVLGFISYIIINTISTSGDIDHFTL
jgi:hypothetical protein